MRYLIIFLILIFIATCAIQSTAQSLTDTTIVLEEVSVSSVRAPRYAPVTNSLVNMNSISTSNTSHEISTILNRNVSFTSFSDNGIGLGYSYYKLRNVDQTRINATLDGVPLNEPEDQGAYTSNYPAFTSFVESYQVQRGTGTSTNGTSAYVGSINFESVSLFNKENETNLSATYGSFDTRNTTVSYLNPVSNVRDIGYYIQFANTHTSGFRNHSGHDGYSVFAKTQYTTHNTVWSAIAFSGVSYNDMSYLATSESDLESNVKMNYLTTDEKDKFNQNVIALSYNKFITDNLSVASTLYANNINGTYNVLIDGLWDFNLNSKWFGLNRTLFLTYDNYTFIVGLNASMYERNHSMYIENVKQYENIGYKNEASTFVKTEASFGDLLLYGDVQLRYVNFKYKSLSSDVDVNPVSWRFINPKFGVSYSPSETVSVYAYTGQTYREPTRNDMFGGFDNLDESNVEFVGELYRVKPEHVNNYELGIRYSTEHVKLNLNAYVLDFRNEIAPIGEISYIGLPLRKNVPNSRRSGLETEYEINLLASLTLNGNVAYQNSNISKYKADYDDVTYYDVPHLLSPELILNNSLKFNVSNIEFEWIARYVSSSYLDNTENDDLMLPSYLTLDAHITYTFNNVKASILLNRIDMNGPIYTSGYVVDSERYFYVSPGFNALLKLNITL